jgi:hypothetical protein
MDLLAYLDPSLGIVAGYIYLLILILVVIVLLRLAYQAATGTGPFKDEQ